jgi:hypothetical protein
MNSSSNAQHNTDDVAPVGGRVGGFRRRVVAIALAIFTVAGVFACTGGNQASAAYPGVFNNAQCIPSYRAVIQDVEAYRSTADEYVQVQGALVNASTGAVVYSQWALGTGSTAHAGFYYTNLASGQYSVWYHWAVWNPASRSYVYSGWIQVTGAGLQTFGYETQPNVFVGGSTGVCAI